MGISKFERETVILFNEQDKDAKVYTYNKPLAKKLDNLCKEHKAEFITSNESGGRTYLIPKHCVKISVRKQMNLTIDQRQDIAKRLNRGKAL